MARGTEERGHRGGGGGRLGEHTHARRGKPTNGAGGTVNPTPLVARLLYVAPRRVSLLTERAAFAAQSAPRGRGRRCSAPGTPARSRP
jgi:hypothetical protein